MIGDKRNYSISIWDHKDNFLCLLKPSSGSVEGQSYDEDLIQNIYGEETLSFTIPAYINEYEKNNKWDYIFNEQKIRYIEYDDVSNKPINIKEFILKHYEESRNGYEKIIKCECESYTIYELSKKGWSITFNTDYITQYEMENNPEDYLTLDYWLRKIFYVETNLGRVSTTTECTYLLQGLQLRDEEGFPIDDNYSIDRKGNYYLKRISEPICEYKIPNEYLNPSGWTWEIQAIDPRRVDTQKITNILYDNPTIDKYIEVTPNNFSGYSYQCGINESDDKKILKPHPIAEKDSNSLRYVTSIKKRLVSCERSNIFSIIQELCSVFNVWAYFVYNYDDQGRITERKILFKTSSVKENVVFDFSFGKNLQSCSRVIDSNELISKLIIPDINSGLDSDKILSIKQSSANQTGEGYIYNFDYYYNSGNLTRLSEAEKNSRTSVTNHSDEYYINFHCGKLKNLNTQITNIQNFLVPLYNRQISLSTDLTLQESTIIAIKDNMRSIQDKIDAIPKEQQIIESWSSFTTEYNYIGTLKTISTTTIDGLTKGYIDFGREDVLYSEDLEVQSYSLTDDGELKKGEVFSIPGYVPRFYKLSTWNNTTVTDADFTYLIPSLATPDFSKIGDADSGFVKGLFINNPGDLGRTWLRIRYKYAPLSYYYKLLKDYWDKLIQAQRDAVEVEDKLQDINNKIINNEIILKNLLAEKNELILQFEKKYSSYIKEGYWEPTDYKSQISSEEINTANNTSIFEGYIEITKKLSELKLNNSLNNFSYYVPLEIKANNIDIDSIQVNLYSPLTTYNTYSVLPGRKDHDYEIFIDQNNEIILGISPTLINSYKINKYQSRYYCCDIIYNDINNNRVTLNKQLWTFFNDDNSPIIKERYIYLSNDNILTDTIRVYGNSVTQNNLLEYGTDYTYSFDYAGYTENGQRVPLDEQDSYNENIYYDYIIKINLKNTDKVNSYIQNNYIVKYSIETTLQYLYNDALATSKKYSEPQVTYNISVVDLSSLNEYKNYKPILGQKVPIFDTEMKLNGYEGIITSIERNLENPENTRIELATYQTKFEDIFQKLTVTMTDIKYNQNEILNAANAFTVENGNNVIKPEIFQRSLEENDFLINLGVNNEISIDRQSGITLLDQDNNKAVKIIGNGIFLTNDYNYTEGSQWKTGITGDGINASAITVGNIDTKQISIWNVSEGQIRFVWNEQGLFAYGDTGVAGNSENTMQDFIDYNKYVKFNSEGLNFEDSYVNNGIKIIRSALSLGWSGLKISAQNESLQLDAVKGLVLKQWNNGNSIIRLELGKLENDTIYGLKLYDTSGNTSFQSDSDGNLWLSKYINIGGSFSSSTHKPQNATAGITGVESNVSNKYRMGVIRDMGSGDIIWSNNPIRFWAGPQTKNNYLANLAMSINDLPESVKTNFNSLSDNDPALARFKVDSSGNIIASGIDVGGWIGAGKLLRSKNYEAILRSDGYTDNNPNFPVLAIGLPSNSDTTGLNHNFRVYKDGSVIITKGDLATFTVTQHGLEFVNSNSNYITGVYAYANTDDYVFRAGPANNPNFSVDGKGNVQASKITITGSQGNWIINSPYFQITNNGQIGAGAQYGSFPTEANNGYKFSVDSGGTIRFRGDIKAYYAGQWYNGLDNEIIDIPTPNSNTRTAYRVVQGLIVSRIYNN